MKVNQRLAGFFLIPLFFIAIISATINARQKSAPKPPREYSASPANQDKESEWVKSPVRAAKGMVVSDELLASAAGLEILKRGGNAIDSAVAVAFALAVVEPAAGNIGGGGFMLGPLANGKARFFDYRKMGPGKATRDKYVGADGKVDPQASLIGYRSVAVPGTSSGLALGFKKYGTMK